MAEDEEIEGEFEEVGEAPVPVRHVADSVPGASPRIPPGIAAAMYAAFAQLFFDESMTKVEFAYGKVLRDNKNSRFIIYISDWR